MRAVVEQAVVCAGLLHEVSPVQELYNLVVVLARQAVPLVGVVVAVEEEWLSLSMKHKLVKQ
jgi:hypothetical protein